MNIVGVKDNDVVFDPMCGSGTTNIEAALNGIDYVENDKTQLEFLGYDIERLKKEMIGLNGKTKKGKIENTLRT